MSEILVPFTEALMYVVQNERIGRQTDLKFDCEHCGKRQVFPKGSSNPAIKCCYCEELMFIEGFYITTGSGLT